MQTRHLIIMLTDIKGFTSKTASFSRTQVMELIKKHEELVLPVVQKFKGTLVKTIGDAFLVTFDSPTDAVEVPVTGAPPAAVMTAGVRAGFWRRLVSLTADLCIFTIAMNMLGLQSCGPRAKIETRDSYGSQEMTVKKIDISPAGIAFKPDNGETITPGKEELSKTDANGAKGVSL